MFSFEGRRLLLLLGRPFSGGLGIVNCTFLFLTKILAVKFFSNFGLQTPGTGSRIGSGFEFTLKCWIQIRIKWTGIRNTVRQDWRNVTWPWPPWLEWEAPVPRISRTLRRSAGGWPASRPRTSAAPSHPCTSGSQLQKRFKATTPFLCTRAFRSVPYSFLLRMPKKKLIFFLITYRYPQAHYL